MIIERYNKVFVFNIYDIGICDGQHGIGAYFYPQNSPAMRRYYSRENKYRVIAEIDDSLVFDASQEDYDYWRARQLMYDNPDKKAFIFKHIGHGIPNGLEIVITEIQKLTIL